MHFSNGKLTPIVTVWDKLLERTTSDRTNSQIPFYPFLGGSTVILFATKVVFEPLHVLVECQNECCI